MGSNGAIEDFLDQLGRAHDPGSAILEPAATNLDTDAFYDFSNHQLFFEPGIGHRTRAIEVLEGDQWILDAIEEQFSDDSFPLARYAEMWDESVRRRMQHFMLLVGRKIGELTKSRKDAPLLWRDFQFRYFGSSLVMDLSPAILMLDSVMLDRFRTELLEPTLTDVAAYPVHFYTGSAPIGGPLVSFDGPVYVMWIFGPADAPQPYKIAVPAYRAMHASYLALLEDPSADQYIYDWMTVDAPPSASVDGDAPYPEGTVNFGLRVTYRQQWRHIGNQYGDIVRTIPLGPKQVEKVSIRVLRRNRVTQSLETSTAEESTEEAVSSVKDSNEIVNEAAKTNRWGLTQRGQGGFDCGLWNVGGSTDFNYGEEARESSRETKSRITENMQKTANKVRRETKVSISLEREETFEATRASEITNPNDEIAITYVYQKLLKQYRITTYLAEVAPVVFVAETVEAVDLAWIRKNVQAIEGALLDESFREFLASLRQAAPPSAHPADLELNGELNHLMTSARTAMSKLADVKGGVQNIFDSSVEAFTGELASQRERKRQEEARRELEARLLEHVRLNQLHYCRAVWESEDPDARMRRYRGILVPDGFRFETDVTNFPAEGRSVTGTWRPGSEVVPLSDIINPAGPIGFTGNYAIYHLATTFRTRGYVPMYAYYRHFYSGLPRAAPWRADGGPVAGLKVSFPKPFLVTYGRYRLRVAGGGTPSLAVSLIRPDGDEEELPVTSVWERLTPAEQASGEFDDYRRVFAIGYDIFWVRVIDATGEYLLDIWPPDLRDPELIEMEARYPLPPFGETEEETEALADYFTDELVRDMAVHLPGLRSLLAREGEMPDPDAAGDASASTIWLEANVRQRRILYDFYHEYRLRKANTRQIVVDTNNVVLNLHTGTGSAMEAFKRLHRLVDAMKVVSESKKLAAEAEQATTETDRRAQRVADKDLSDPDTERTIVIRDGR